MGAILNLIAGLMEAAETENRYMPKNFRASRGV